LYMHQSNFQYDEYEYNLHHDNALALSLVRYHLHQHELICIIFTTKYV
jgi:hypothetical protein